jgi:glycosyltransferase involved in cell wall biosynthesis
MFCRNEAPYLCVAIESILAQTHNKFNLLIIDDASTDQSFQIAHQFAERDNRVTVVRNHLREGYSSSYRKTFELAGKDCKYFAWASGHDIHEPMWLERCLKVIQADSSVALVYCQNDRISKYGEYLRNEGLYFEADQNSAFLRLIHLYKNGRGFGNMIYGLFRVDFLKDCGVYRKLLVADIVLIYEIIIYGKLIQLNECLWHRRFDFFADKKTNMIKNMIRRQRRNMFQSPPLYVYIPWPIVNSAWIATASLTKLRGNFLIRFQGVVAAMLFLCKFLRIQRIAD